MKGIGAEQHTAVKNGDIATITDIQRYSVHDGPGIRSLVFFKGCPLRCQWCHNPETHNIHPELMMNEEACIGCGACMQVCPEHAVIIRDGHMDTDRTKCKVCGKCTEVCYSEARKISGVYYTVDEIFEKVIRDKSFYDNTGGGVTLSGGEVLMYAEFAEKLLKKLHNAGIDTAIETCGYASWERFEKVLAYTDHVLYDIKHCDSDIHKKFTGVGNELILENLYKAAEMGKDIIVRVPFIPGVNDNEDVEKKIAKIAKDIHAKAIHLLPFHQIATSKWDGIGKEYLFRNVREPSKEELERIKKIIEPIGVPVVIGGN